MKEYGWTASNGSEIKIVVEATAKLNSREIKADGQETGIYETSLIETLNSIVYLDGKSLGSISVKPIKCDNPSVIAVLNGKIGLTQEHRDGIRAAEKTAVCEARETEEIQTYFKSKKAAAEKANEIDKEYKAHTAIMNKAMGN